jgi:citrate lyase subunit beta/citryl-CoA lyase
MGLIGNRSVRANQQAAVPSKPHEVASHMRPIRSLLICTATIERHVKSAISGNADAVVLDLETTVADSEKNAARSAVIGVLTGACRPDIFVRINEIDSPYVFDDLLMLQSPKLRGVMLPRAEDARQVVVLDWMLSQLEKKFARTGPPIEIVPLVETGRGVENLISVLSASPRIHLASFGVADYGMDMGIQFSRNEDGLNYIRQRMVHGSRACGLEPPIDTVWLDLNDDEGMRLALERGKRQGFFGKLCMHPKQVEEANRLFTPTSEEVAQAKRIVGAFETAMANNVAATHLDGKLVDLPIVRSAQRIIDLSSDLAGA